MSTPTLTDTCDMCSHSIEVHDKIATRFCAATAAGALSRGCICPIKDEPVLVPAVQTTLVPV